MSVQVNSDVLETNSFDNTIYRQVSGSLVYLIICSDLNIGFAVGHFFKFMENPTTGLRTCAKRVHCYIKETMWRGICYDGNLGFALRTGYSDADRAGCKIS